MPIINKKTGKRDFVAERLAEKPARKVARNNRNKARRKMGLKDGDPRVVDHKKELSKGGSNSKSNLRVTTKKANDAKEARRRKK
jgi:5-methylcytosine-specific restriction endonuclease McrA